MKRFAREFGTDAGTSGNAVLGEPCGWGSERRQEAARLGVEVGEHVSSLACLDVVLILTVVQRVTSAVDVVDRSLAA